MNGRTIISVAQDLEHVHADLRRIKDFLNIVLDDIFSKDGEVSIYAMQYASLLEVAFSKAYAREKEVLEIANILYDIGKLQKEQ